MDRSNCSFVQEAPDHPELSHYVGRQLVDIAKEEGKHHIEAMLDIAIAGDLKVLFRTNDLCSVDPEKVGELAPLPVCHSRDLGRWRAHKNFSPVARSQPT